MYQLSQVESLFSSSNTLSSFALSLASIAARLVSMYAFIFCSLSFTSCITVCSMVLKTSCKSVIKSGFEFG